MGSTRYAWLLSTLCAASVLAAEPRPVNVVLLLADDQGWNGTSVMLDPALPASSSDYYRTPHLARLASEGMRFSQAYAPHSNCSPTRMSLQTGKSPARLGATDIVDVVPGSPGFMAQFHALFYVDKPLHVTLPIADLPTEETTIPELLRRHDARYVSAHFGKWHMNGGGPGAHGFDVHDGATGNTEGQDGMPDPKRTGAITASALAFLDQRGVDRRPFFLQVSYYAVHNPTRATPAAIREWEARPPGRVHRNAEYAAMTEALDASVGAVLDRLHALALDETTYVIYTSDNGGETMNGTTSNAPLARSKTFVWEGGIRVPLIVRGPDIAAGVSSRVPVIGWDLMPTIAQWIGAEDTLASDLDGGSLTDVLRGGNTVRRPGDEFVWFYPHYRNMKGVTPQAAIRDGRYKLIVEYESGRRWLFDLEADVGETTDLSAAHPEIAQRLAARLDGYLDGVGAKRPGVNANYDPARDPALRGVSVGTGRSGS